MSKEFRESSRKRKSRDLDDDDAITILNAVVEFRSNHGGSAPTPSTMKPVLDAVKGSLRDDLTIGQLYNKFRTLKHRYYRAVQFGVGPAPFDRTFFDLSVRAWGEKKPKAMTAEENGLDHHHHGEGDDEEENHDLGASFKYVTGQATKCWGEEGLSLATLELGLKHMDRSKAAALEKRWRKHLEAELRIVARSFDVNKDLLAALVAGQKGLNS